MSSKFVEKIHLISPTTNPSISLFQKLSLAFDDAIAFIEGIVRKVKQ